MPSHRRRGDADEDQLEFLGALTSSASMAAIFIFGVSVDLRLVGR